MVNIIKQELEIEESFRKKIEFICEFTNIKPIFKNGGIRKIDKTNLIYIEPHSITTKNINFLFFNFTNDIFINNLSNKIKVSELENYIKTNFKLKLFFLFIYDIINNRRRYDEKRN